MGSVSLLGHNMAKECWGVVHQRGNKTFFKSFKESPNRIRLCFRVCSQARRLLHYSGDDGLLLMVLLITAACCLSEDWLGIKQSASTYTPHISSFVINAALSHLERAFYIRSQEQRRCRCEQSATEAIKHPKCSLADLPPGIATGWVSSFTWSTKPPV